MLKTHAPSMTCGAVKTFLKTKMGLGVITNGLPGVTLYERPRVSPDRSPLD